VDDEVVGREALVAAQDLGGVVDLSLEGRGDLHRLDRTAEGPREDTRHHALEPLLEAVECAHCAFLGRCPRVAAFRVGVPRACLATTVGAPTTPRGPRARCYREARANPRCRAPRPPDWPPLRATLSCRPGTALSCRKGDEREWRNWQTRT